MTRKVATMESASPLKDLIDSVEFGVKCIHFGRHGASVRSAHTSDVDLPGRWLEPGSALLTHGPRFKGRENDSALANDLIDDLEAAGVGAILFGVGVYLDQVPPALESVARHRNFTLLEVPPETPFYRIENLLNESRISPDSYPLKRSLRITNQLLESMSAEDPAQSLVTTLGFSCRGTAALYEDTGEIIQSTGDGPTRLIFSEVMEQARRTGFESKPFKIGRWLVMWRTVVVRGINCTLAIASRNEAVLDEIGDLLLDTAQRLLAVQTGFSQAAIGQAQHESNQLLTALQDSILPAREQRYWERMRAFRFEPYQPLRAIWGSPLEPGSGTQLPGLVELQAQARIIGLGILLAQDVTADSSVQLVALAGDTPELRGWLHTAAQSYLLGLSEPLHSLIEVPRGMHEALVAWHIAQQQHATKLSAGHLSGEPGVVWLDEVDLSTWVLARADALGLDMRSERFLRPLRGHESLTETLTTFLAHDQDIAATAAFLFLHTNTVRYRLKRCEDLLNVSLQSPGAMSNLHLALFHDVALVKARLWLRD